jgi:hypothetical protein
MNKDLFISCSTISKLQDAVCVPEALKLFLVEDPEARIDWEWVSSLVTETKTNCKLYCVPYHATLMVEDFPEVAVLPAIVILQGSQVITRLYPFGDMKKMLKTTLNVYRAV